LGITRIISPSAVGSLKEEIKTGDFVLPTQFIDFTKSRRPSLSEDGKVIHISVADPFCPELQKIVSETANNQDITLHEDCTYACIEGPRLSTIAESRFYKSTGADIIGMTLVPEWQLAREAQMCYVSISTVTDYDVWAEKPVTAIEVMDTLSKNVQITKKLLAELIDKMSDAFATKRTCSCEKALTEAEFYSSAHASRFRPSGILRFPEISFFCNSSITSSTLYSNDFSLFSISSDSFTPMFCPPIRPNAIAKNSNELSSISNIPLFFAAIWVPSTLFTCIFRFNANLDFYCSV